MKKPVFVTKTFLPPREEFDKLVDQIWESNHLTNNGPLVKELDRKVPEYLGIDPQKFRLVSNGTIALQLSIHAFDFGEGEIITTPFSYVATTSSILWEHFTPVFVDIDPDTLNIDPAKIEAAITPKTKAILPVHVFGNPCDVEAIQTIADKYDLKVIYDAAHAFGVKYKGKSIFDYGDIATCSFHATKLFHTTEGGAVYTKDSSVIEKIELMKRFGHDGDSHLMLGINAKASEFNGAMGLANLKYIDQIIADRKRAHGIYDKYLKTALRKQKIADDTEYNYAYYPVIFESEAVLLKVKKAFEISGIYSRRYFYPSLNNLPYVEEKRNCQVSEAIASKILCLPLYYDIEEKDILRICDTLLSVMDVTD